MKQKEEAVALYAMTVATNDYNETVRTYTNTRNIDMIISFQSGITQIGNETLSTVYSVIGLTNDQLIKVYDKIQRNNTYYLVKSIIDTGKRRVCYLQEDVPV